MSNRKCNKFEHDKYYTPQHVVDYVVKKTVEIVGSDFDCVVEPSAGNGAFIQAIEDSFKGSKKVYMDLYPDADGVVQQDYLEYEHKHEGKTLVIGNPPFGRANNLSVQFFKKSIQYADVVVFLLPISQKDNLQKMYEFDLVCSEDVGKEHYFNAAGDMKEVHCCLNMYTIPQGKTLNNKIKYSFNNFLVQTYYSGRSDASKDYGDNGMCAWGAVGKRVSSLGEYAKEMYFSGDSAIVEFCMGYDWSKVCSQTASPNLVQWQVYEEVKKHFNLIEGDFDENKYSK